MSNIARLCFAFYSSMLSGYSEIPNNHCFIKLTVFKYMLNMFAYIRFARLVNICQLILCQPQILIGKSHRYTSNFVIILI